MITIYDPIRGVLLTHETGHNLGLLYHEAEPHSVMNYRYSLTGFTGGDQQLRWSCANGQDGTLCDVQDPWVCTENGNCECNEWDQLLHPFPTCGDGETDGQWHLPSYGYARCCAETRAHICVCHDHDAVPLSLRRDFGPSHRDRLRRIGRRGR